MSVCQGLISQVEAAALSRDASAVTAIRLRIGPLSGIEISLLEQAYPLAARGTLAETARLTIHAAPIRIRCLVCGEETDGVPNNLSCTHCGDHHTQLLSGDEMLLESIELTV